MIVTASILNKTQKARIATMQIISAKHLRPLSQGELCRHLIVRQSNRQSNIYHKSSVFHPFISIECPFILKTSGLASISH